MRFKENAAVLLPGFRDSKKHRHFDVPLLAFIRSGVVALMFYELSTGAALHWEDEDTLENSALPLFGVFLGRKIEVVKKRDKSLPPALEKSAAAELPSDRPLSHAWLRSGLPAYESSCSLKT